MKKTVLLLLVFVLAFSAFASGMTLGVRSTLLELGPEFGFETEHFGANASIGFALQTVLFQGIKENNWSEINPLDFFSIFHFRGGVYWKCINNTSLNVNLGFMYAGYAILDYKADKKLEFASYSLSPTVRVLFKQEQNENNGFFVEASAPFLGLMLAENQKVTGGIYAKEGEENASNILGGALITTMGLVIGVVNFGYTWSF